MAKIERFEDIKSWQKARKLTGQIYQLSETGQLVRDYGLKNQLRRACVSIMNNISEGFERDGNNEFIQFLSTAKGSCGEVRSQLYILKDLGYINEKDFTNLYAEAIEINRMIGGFIKYLKGTKLQGSKFNRQ